MSLFIKRNIVLFLIVILQMFFVIVAFADEPASKESSWENGMQLDLGKLLDIDISTGSFLDLDLKKSPVNLTVISNDKIYNSGAVTLSDVLEIYVPSFQYMYNRWNGDIWAIRGVTSDLNDKVLFLVNGIKMNLQARNGAASEMNLGLFGDIERIEILQGPAGMVYGSGAIAGVVNVVTYRSKKSSGDISVHGRTNKNVGANSWNNAFGLEGVSHTQIDSNISLTVSAGYRMDEGNGDGKTLLYGYQDWPENTEYSQAWPSKGAHGKTPGNIRASIDLKYKDFSLYARYTKQQNSTSSMFGRYPWDESKGVYTEPLKYGTYWDEIADTLIKPVEIITDNSTPFDTINDTIIYKNWSDTVTIDSKSGLQDYVNNKNIDIKKSNDENCPPIEIDGKLYTYDELGSKYSQANQTRRFNMDNIAVEAKYKLKLQKNSLNFKAGLILNQNQSFFENNGFNDTRAPWSTDFFWPDLMWSTYGEKRYYGSALFMLKSVPTFQSASGFEYRYDDIGSDFQGRNMEWGSESMHVVSPVVYHNISIYTENYYEPIDMVSILLGLRYDKHTRTDGVLSPKIATVLTPSPDHVIKLLWQMSSNNGDANSYEFNGSHYNFDGTINETHVNNADGTGLITDTNAVVIVPTKEELQSLKPEKSYSFELMSSHNFFNNLLHFYPAISYNVLKDNFVWNGALQRKVNIGNYNAFNLEATVEVTHKKFNIGLSHSFQRPVNTNKDQMAEYTIPTLTFDSVQVNPTTGKTMYKMSVDNDNLITKKVPLLKEFVTYDGQNFLNIVTNTTKLNADYTPINLLTFSTNMRIFWGFAGREDVNKTIFDGGDSSAQANADYLGFDGSDGILKSIAVKWNIGTHLNLPGDFKISLFFLNVLGDRENNNAIRWQNMVSNLKQRKYYTTDTRAIELRINKKF